MSACHIANARQRDDNTIAVANAIQLSACYLELARIYGAAELHPSDYVEDQMKLYSSISGLLESQEQGRWIEASIMSDKSISSLKNAISSGRLPVWRLHNAEEILLMPLLLEHNSVKYGIYKSHQHPELDMQGAYLWVKNLDWKLFLESETPQKDRAAGRPNLTDEAVKLHECRCSNGQAISQLTKEAKAIHSILTERHKDDPTWSLKSDSIAKALRNHAKCQK